MIIFLLFFLIFSSFASANNHFIQLDKMALGKRFHFGVGLDLFQTQYKEQRYKFDDKSAFKNPVNNAISRIAWNISYRVAERYPFYVGLRTNRGINFPIREVAYDNVTKQNVRINIKSQADSVYFATAVHSRIFPFIIATRLQSKPTIYYNNGLNFTTRGLTTMYGFGLATPLGNKGTASFTYYLPNKDFNTKRAVGVSYNYIIF